MYYSEEEYGQAVSWFRKAAEHGYADAEYYLGLMYDNGQGVPKDGGEANRWFQKAAAQGQADATNRLNAAGSIIQRIRSTVATIQNANVRDAEVRKQLDQSIARLAAANDKMPLSELYAMKAEADKAMRIVDDANEFNSVSEIATKKIREIEAELDTITSDAPIILNIKSAVDSVKVAQAGSSLLSLKDALWKLNQLYDNNREKLLPWQFRPH